VWHCYDGRAGRERYIREIRADYALTKIPTRAFAAHALYLEVMRLAYNLVTAFQRTGLPAERQSDTWTKLRHQLFWVPGELTRPPNRPTLRLVNSSLITMWAEKILHRVHQVETAGRLKLLLPKIIERCTICGGKTHFSWQIRKEQRTSRRI